MVVQKGGKMAEIRVPIQVNLPDDWVEQIMERLKNDSEAEWAEVIRCKDCKYMEHYAFPPEYDTKPYCSEWKEIIAEDGFCSRAER